jgi:hypothetical protein
MKRGVTILVISVLSLFSLNGQTQAEFDNLLNQINSDSIQKTIEDLVLFENRFCNDTPMGNLQVANYLVNRLKSYGIENAVVDSFLFQGYTWLTGNLNRYFYNAKGTIPGSVSTDTTYIIGAHLDAISLNDNWVLTNTAPGADDNASGCAVFIEIARIFHVNNLVPKYNIDFMGWDAEEIGLKGAYYDAQYRATLGQVGKTIVLNNDMVAHQPSNQPYKLDLYQYDNSVDMYNTAFDIFETYTNITPIFPLDNSEMRQRTDSWAYNQSGFNAIFAIEHYFTDFYHTEQDLPGTLNFDFAKEVTKYNFAMLYHYNVADVFNLDTTSNIQEVDLSKLISLFPNPTFGEININPSQAININTITIIDLSGRTVFNIVIETPEMVRFDLSYLQSGVYIVKIDTSSGVIFKKMIKK